MLTVFICEYTGLAITVALVIGALSGALVAAWWQDKPLSDLEKRVELHSRDVDEHSEGL